MRELGDQRRAIALDAIAHGKFLGAKSAREAAEMVQGRALTDEEWARFGRAWGADGDSPPEPLRRPLVISGC